MAHPHIELNDRTPPPAISLREIDRSTARQIFDLQVAPGQERFVASNAVTIAQAYFEPPGLIWIRAVYAGDTPVGLLALWDERAKYHLLRLMIDQRFQGLGYGRQAMRQLIDHVRTLPDAPRLTLFCEPGEGSPQAFYERLGFLDTGEMDDSAKVMALALD